jgi:hypothetical protein
MILVLGHTCFPGPDKTTSFAIVTKKVTNLLSSRLLFCEKILSRDGCLTSPTIAQVTHKSHFSSRQLYPEVGHCLIRLHTFQLNIRTDSKRSNPTTTIRWRHRWGVNNWEAEAEQKINGKTM